MDEAIYYQGSSFKGLANVLTCGGPVPDSLRKEELNDSWFLWRLLAMSHALGLPRLELPPGAGSAWLDTAMAALTAVLLSRGFFWWHHCADHRCICKWPCRVWVVDGIEKLIFCICAFASCILFAFAATGLYDLQRSQAL
mmetsp:Transcript_47633/g.111172  ORF Transcript_47633/g.111172 Transcript_47633/m.111172 type:complete len:140 (-) Transcript_47633:2118-2537(-)